MRGERREGDKRLVLLPFVDSFNSLIPALPENLKALEIAKHGPKGKPVILPPNLLYFCGCSRLALNLDTVLCFVVEN